MEKSTHPRRLLDPSMGETVFTATWEPSPAAPGNGEQLEAAGLGRQEVPEEGPTDGLGDGMDYLTSGLDEGDSDQEVAETTPAMPQPAVDDAAMPAGPFAARDAAASAAEEKSAEWGMPAAPKVAMADQTVDLGAYFRAQADASHAAMLDFIERNGPTWIGPVAIGGTKFLGEMQAEWEEDVHLCDLIAIHADGVAAQCVAADALLFDADRADAILIEMLDAAGLAVRGEDGTVEVDPSALEGDLALARAAFAADLTTVGSSTLESSLADLDCAVGAIEPTVEAFKAGIAIIRSVAAASRANDERRDLAEMQALIDDLDFLEASIGSAVEVAKLASGGLKAAKLVESGIQGVNAIDAAKDVGDLGKNATGMAGSIYEAANAGTIASLEERVNIADDRARRLLGDGAGFDLASRFLGIREAATRVQACSENVRRAAADDRTGLRSVGAASDRAGATTGAADAMIRLAQVRETHRRSSHAAIELSPLVGRLEDLSSLIERRSMGGMVTELDKLAAPDLEVARTVRNHARDVEGRIRALEGRQVAYGGITCSLECLRQAWSGGVL